MSSVDKAVILEACNRPMFQGQNFEVHSAEVGQRKWKRVDLRTFDAPHIGVSVISIPDCADYPDNDEYVSKDAKSRGCSWYEVHARDALTIDITKRNAFTWYFIQSQAMYEYDARSR